MKSSRRRKSPSSSRDPKSPELNENERPKPKIEKFVLGTGHEAHTLLEVAESDLKACGGAYYDDLELNDDDIAGSENGSNTTDETSSEVNGPARSKKFNYMTKLHLNAIPRKGDRTRRMILATSRPHPAKPSKVALPGPQTYEELESLMKSLDQNLMDKDKLLQQQHMIYQVAINHLSEENIAKQQKAIRFSTMQHEIEYLQHHVHKLSIMRVGHDEETTPRSAVYRHSLHIGAMTDMGIRIYSIEDHPREISDRIVVARRLTATPSTPHNKARHNTGRRYVNEAQPRLMKNQKYIERDKEFL
ncbi:hypothetical protein LEN26_015041 [Aphanomyces euteiches]|nr:hypothetical protein LEN26_015041 [Aphanomyces euteiches]KAH9192661.1 hypothetical protein AeNC1_005361 [Aphanomyces euteiches]